MLRAFKVDCVVKRLRTVSTLVSVICLLFFVIMWPLSYHRNLSRYHNDWELMPGDSIPLLGNLSMGFEGGAVWFYTYETPYRGGLIAVRNSSDPPANLWSWHLGGYGFGHKEYRKPNQMSERSCDLPGVYFRHLSIPGGNYPPYVTLRMSLCYPVLFFALLPLLWIVRYKAARCRSKSSGPPNEAASGSSISE